MKKHSIWLENMQYKVSPKLKEDIEVDVLVIGGGITGLSTCYHLMNQNLKVCLVERNKICHGVTARTTGKLTYLQETIYSDLKKTYNIEKAKLYLDSQIEAINIVDKIIKKHKIECDYNIVDSYVFTNDDKRAKKIESEKEILQNFKIPVQEHRYLPDNYSVIYGISVGNTAVFHPIKYLTKIKELCENNGILIYENTKIIDINKKEHYICKTNNHQITAKTIVLAVHYPYFLFPFLMPLKKHLEKSYISAFQTDKNLYFSAITAGKPTLSIRYLGDNEKVYKLCLNGSHNLAFKNNEVKNFDNLTSEIKKEPDFLWSNKDIITNDQLPYIGKIEENMLLATGYNTWGMTNGSLAGKILSDIILNKDNQYIDLFCPKRGFHIHQAITFPIDVASNIKSFVGTKINKNKSWYNERVNFEKKDGKDIAIYVDEKGKKHTVYNKCPHLKCSLIFNEQEKTWDCPCHGSRFDIDGKCIEGPSNYDIIYRDE